jgi:hypothetical protein
VRTEICATLRVPHVVMCQGGATRGQAHEAELPLAKVARDVVAVFVLASVLEPARRV